MNNKLLILKPYTYTCIKKIYFRLNCIFYYFYNKKNNLYDALFIYYYMKYIVNGRIRRRNLQ